MKNKPKKAPKKTTHKPPLKEGKTNRQGEGGGQPPKYASKEVLKEAITAYFTSCYNKTGKKQLAIANKAGLCLALGISRDTYSEYRKKYPDTIKSADAYMENEWVQRLRTNAPTGAIFYLKNAFKETYKDRHETDVTTKGQAIQVFNESQLERIAGRIFNGRAASQA